jgi:hypothetical protein
MERVHQLIVEDRLDAEDYNFWRFRWHFIASAKVTLETKIAAYYSLNRRGTADLYTLNDDFLYKMIRADRAFVVELNSREGKGMMNHCCRCIIVIDDDAAAFARFLQELSEGRSAAEKSHIFRHCLHSLLMKNNAPRCLRILFQDKAFREAAMRE